jgi:hypothetical protein
MLASVSVALSCWINVNQNAYQKSEHFPSFEIHRYIIYEDVQQRVLPTPVFLMLQMF